MSAAIFFLFIGGWLMARFMVTTGTTRHMVDMFVGFNMSYNTLLFAMFVLFLILGCILESTSILVLTMPFMFPITQQYGVDPVWFGVFVTMMMVLAIQPDKSNRFRDAHGDEFRPAISEIRRHRIRR